MKILFVADVSIANVIGGAERVLFEQSSGLAQKGHRVHVLTRLLSVHEEDSKMIGNVKEWRYSDGLRENILRCIINTHLNCKSLFEFLHEKYDFDIINFHQPFSAIGVNLSPLSKNIAKIYTCHSLSFEEFASRNSNWGGFFKKAANFFHIQSRKRIERNALGKSTKIVTLSNFTKRKLYNQYYIPKSKINVIPGGVDLEKFKPFDNKKIIRQQLKIPQNKIVLLTVRNLVQRMGIENLIIAIKTIIKKNREIHLVIGGEGHLHDRLTALTRAMGIAENVTFTGFIPEEQLPFYYQMADLFVLPTMELEGFGLVTLEAMASGLPVVGTPIGGTREILNNFDSQFLFAGTDPDAIAKLLSEKYRLIKKNPQLWKEVGNKCRHFIEINYSWEKNLDSLEHLYCELLDE